MTLQARSRTRIRSPARTAGCGIVTGVWGQDGVGVDDAAFPIDWRMAHMQSARAVNGDVAVRVGSCMAGSSQQSRKKAGWTRARWEPATTPSWPERLSAPVTEVPTVRLYSSAGEVPPEAAVLGATAGRKCP